MLDIYLIYQVYIKGMAMSLESEFIIQNALLFSSILKKIDGELSVHGISFTEYMVMHH